MMRDVERADTPASPRPTARGFAALTAEDRYQVARLGAAAANGRRTPEERRALARKAAGSRTPEQRSEAARAAAIARHRKHPHPLVGQRVLVRKTPRTYMLFRDTEATVVRVRGLVVRVQLPGGSFYWVRRDRVEILP